jgi:CubicO group peptidase (beta-lactamase class C family)
MTTKPESVNVSSARLARAVEVLREGIAAGAMPGAAVCAFRGGQMFLHDAVGTLDGVRPTAPDTIYDLASLTKPMATGASVLTLVEQGRLTLTTTLPDLLGDSASHLANVTVYHLLTHTSGLPAWTACYESGEGHDAAISAILRLPTAPPGTKYEYSCLGFILLHRIVEIVAGQPLDVFVREHVFAPLGLTDIGYRPDIALRERIAPTVSGEGPRKGETLIGDVHDGNARAIGGVSGNAGLFGTALEVATFGEALRTEKLFGAPTRARIFENQTKPEIGAHTLLFFASGNGYCPSGDLLSPRTVGHSGFTGTVLTIDPAFDLTVALLTNSVYGDGKPLFLSVRRKFLNAMAAALE